MKREKEGERGKKRHELRREERDRARSAETDSDETTYFFTRRERERETIESLVSRARLVCARDNGIPDSPCGPTVF